MEEKIVSLIIVFYLIIGCIFGLKTVFNIIRDAYRRGLKETSRSVLGLEYGKEEGSTPISLFIFPFAFMLMMWPLTFFDPPDQID